MGFNFFVLGYITKSTVMICPSVKICDFFFFFIASMSTMLAPCRRSEKKKKEKKKRGHCLDTRVWRVVPVSVSDVCWTLVRRQK